MKSDKQINNKFILYIEADGSIVEAQHCTNPRPRPTNQGAPPHNSGLLTATMKNEPRNPPTLTNHEAPSTNLCNRDNKGKGKTTTTRPPDSNNQRRLGNSTTL